MSSVVGGWVVRAAAAENRPAEASVSSKQQREFARRGETAEAASRRARRDGAPPCPSSEMARTQGSRRTTAQQAGKRAQGPVEQLCTVQAM